MNSNRGISFLIVFTGFILRPECGRTPPPVLDLTMYAAVYSAGVYESGNGGLTWVPLNSDAAAVACFVKRLAWGPDGGLLVATSGAGLYRGDASGFHALGLPDDAEVSAVAVTRGAPDTLWAGTRNYGVLMSADDGATWSPRNTGLHFRRVNALSVAGPGGQLYCATDGGLYRHSGGQDWEWLTASAGAWDARAMLLDPSRPGALVLGGAGLDGPPPILVSAPDAGLWEEGGRRLPHGNIFDLAGTTVDGGHVLFAATSRGVYVSRDDGHRWSRFGRRGPGRAIFSLAIAGGQLFAAGEDGIHRTPVDAASWTTLGSGLPRSAVTSVTAGPPSS